MSLRKLSYILLSVCIALTACKEDEENVSYPSLSGTLAFDIPAFIAQNTELTLIPQGVSHPEDGVLGYSWKVSPLMEKSDTSEMENGAYNFNFKDSLGTYTVNCYAFASGYSSTSASQQTTMVKGGIDGSITKHGIRKTDKKITVNGIDYYYTTHAGLDWFRNNLANPAYGAPFINCEVTSNVFGRFYSYEEAVKACPEGWRLPTNADWISLGKALGSAEPSSSLDPIANVAAKLMADIEFNTDKMWTYWPKVGEITNSSLMAFIPAGYANLGSISSDPDKITDGISGRYPTAAFIGVEEYSVFWTADLSEDSNLAYYRFIFEQQPELLLSRGDIKTFGANVRCVRDAE